MKNILFATTALVATAGFAAAEVKVTGFAEMGIYGGSEIETQFHTDIDVTFSMSGEADNGLAFGASVDLDESDGDPAGAFNANSQGGETIFISYGPATLTMGDTDGAFDKAMKEVNLAAGSIQDDETAHAGFSGNGGFDIDDDGVLSVGAGLDGVFDGQVARVDYAFSGLTASLSAEIDDAGDEDPIWGLGIAYSADLAGLTLGVGLGYQTQSDFADVWGISVDTTFANGISAAINYSKIDLADDQSDLTGVDDVTHMGIGFGYTMNALSIGVNYGQYKVDGDEAQSGVGLAVAYDMGGGLVAQMGYGSSNFEDADDTDSFSLGLAMSF